MCALLFLLGGAAPVGGADVESSIDIPVIMESIVGRKTSAAHPTRSFTL
jgi:hypothetical protein